MEQIKAGNEDVLFLSSAGVDLVAEESGACQLQSLTSAETERAPRRGRSVQLSDFRDQRLLSRGEMRNIWCGGRR